MNNLTLTKIILISWAILSLSGCFKYNIEENNKLWGGYKPQSDYLLLQDVFLIRPDVHTFLYKDTGKKEVTGGSCSRLALTPEGFLFQSGGLYSAPHTITDFEKNPEAAVKQDYDIFTSIITVIGIVRHGTIIRTKRIERISGYSWWWGFVEGKTIYAVIKTGPFVGKDVDIEDLSVYTEKDNSSGIILKKPDERLLRLITE